MKATANRILLLAFPAVLWVTFVNTQAQIRTQASLGGYVLDPTG